MVGWVKALDSEATAAAAIPKLLAKFGKQIQSRFSMPATYALALAMCPLFAFRRDLQGNRSHGGRPAAPAPSVTKKGCLHSVGSGEPAKGGRTISGGGLPLGRSAIT